MTSYIPKILQRLHVINPEKKLDYTTTVTKSLNNTNDIVCSTLTQTSFLLAWLIQYTKKIRRLEDKKYKINRIFFYFFFTRKRDSLSLMLMYSRSGNMFIWMNTHATLSPSNLDWGGVCKWASFLPNCPQTPWGYSVLPAKGGGGHRQK